MLRLAETILSRLPDALLAPLLARRPEPLPIPVRSEDWRGPRRDGRRF